MNCNCNGGALGDLGHTVGGQFLLGLLADVDVAIDLGAAAAVDNVLLDLGIADNDAVLLARADLGAVPCYVLVYKETLALALVALSSKNDTVSRDGRSTGQEGHNNGQLHDGSGGGNGRNKRGRHGGMKRKVKDSKRVLVRR